MNLTNSPEPQLIFMLFISDVVLIQRVCIFVLFLFLPYHLSLKQFVVSRLRKLVFEVCLFCFILTLKVTTPSKEKL